MQCAGKMWMHSHWVAQTNPRWLNMICISGLSDTMTSFDESEMQVWDIATKVKHEFGIPRGEQSYYHGYKNLSKSMLVQSPIELTMLRIRVKCAGCGKTQRKRKYQVCRCRDAYYCSSACQYQHWKYHKSDCKASKTQKVEDCEHEYKKVFPSGLRDNNEYTPDLAR